MVALFRSELFRVQKRSQTWMLGGIMTLALICFYGGFTIAHFARPNSTSVIESLQVKNIADNGLGLASLLGAIMVVVFASSLLGSEYGWNTLRPVIARAKNRNSLLTAKWLTVGLFVLAFAAVCVLVSIFGAALGSLISGEPSGLSGSVIVDAVSTTARFFMGFLPIAVLGMTVALLTKSNAAGIAIGIGFGFIEPLLFALLGSISDVFDTIQKGGISWNQERLFGLGGDDNTTSGDALVSAGVLTLWIIFFIAISYRVFNRRDITSG